VQACVSLYGLGVRFNRPLAAARSLPPAAREDVRITLGDLPREIAGEDDTATDLYVGPHARDAPAPSVRFSQILDGAFYRFHYADGTRIVVDRVGRNVWATVPEGATDEDTGTYLLGPTFGFVLRLHGTVCLHASATEIDGQAVAFAGAAGAGKSSLAAAFAQRGHRILTDDVAALREARSGVQVIPAYPRIRLWPDSTGALFGSPEALPRITPTWDKRCLDLDATRHRFAPEPLTLAAIYVIDPRRADRAPAIHHLDPRRALMALVPQMYSTRLLDRGMRAREFELLSRLVADVRVMRLDRPGKFERLAEVCQAVERDFLAERAA
jgi:hypothetical protein